ncbi:MAG: hypothetical protein ACTS73_02665 [Arsenophonus sp. NEOnobi-MAG3]
MLNLSGIAVRTEYTSTAIVHPPYLNYSKFSKSCYTICVAVRHIYQ